MMVLGPKHVGAFLMCKFYKFYICAVVGVITEYHTNVLRTVSCPEQCNVGRSIRTVLSGFKKFQEFAGIIYKNCYCEYRNVH